MKKFRFHFGDCALVLSHDFKTLISDFHNQFENYKDEDGSNNANDDTTVVDEIA